MKTLKTLKESFDTNPGNNFALTNGVTNHLTPINNIITNIRNLFAPRLGIIVEPGEDGISIKLHSSQFFNQNAVNRVLDNYLYNNLNLRQYIQQQGLDFVKLVDLGQYWVVYFLPSDIYSAANGAKCECPKCKCHEMLEQNITEAEMEKLNEDINGEEELEDKTISEIIELIDDNDKIKAASKLAEVIARKMELPDEYYWKAVKDQDGKESVALRWKHTKRRPFGKKIEMVKSILNIYNSGHDAVWVDVFDEKDKLDDDMKTLLENILKLIGAQETKDPCIFDIEEPKQKDDDEDTSSEEETNEEDSKEETSKNDNNNEDNKEGEEDKNK